MASNIHLDAASRRPWLARTTQFLVVAFAILPSISCSRSNEINMAKVAVGHFHDELNAGLSDEIYRGATEEYQHATTPEMNRQLIEAVRRKMGNAGDFQVTGWRQNYSTGGRFLAVECKATFAHGDATESFAWRIQESKALLLGWNINSPLLVMN